MQTRIWDTEQLLTRNFWLKIDPDGLEPCEVCRPTTLAHKGPETGFEEVTSDLLEPRFWPVTCTSPSTPLYIHVEKDFQSHHMQIYSSTLMGGQERERKCVRNA